MKHGAKRAFSHGRTDVRKGITAQAKHIRTRARTDSQRSWQDIAQMYSQRALGRQKGVSQARYSRDVFPGIIFHRFSRLKTYIRRLSCQKQAIRACISAISCHEEAFLASERPSRMHDSHFLPPDSHSLPLLDAQPPLHTEHLAALSWQHFCFEALFDHGSDEHFIGHGIVKAHRSLFAFEIDHRIFHARHHF